MHILLLNFYYYKFRLSLKMVISEPCRNVSLSNAENYVIYNFMQTDLHEIIVSHRTLSVGISNWNQNPTFILLVVHINETKSKCGFKITFNK